MPPYDWKIPQNFRHLHVISGDQEINILTINDLTQRYANLWLGNVEKYFITIFFFISVNINVCQICISISLCSISTKWDIISLLQLIKHTISDHAYLHYVFFSKAGYWVARKSGAVKSCIVRALKGGTGSPSKIRIVSDLFVGRRTVCSACHCASQLDFD